MYSTRTTTLALTLGILAGSVPAAHAGEPKLDSPEKQYNYAIGYQMGQRIQQQMSSRSVTVDPEALMAGLRDMLSGTPPRITQEELQGRHQAAQSAAATRNLERGRKFLAENAGKPGVTVLPSGLQYEVLESGEGRSPSESSQVVVDYRGSLVDGQEFDSSYARGEPATFDLARIIPGFREAVTRMKEGDKWRVVIPAELAYGERGAGSRIGPNETLVFEIKLLEVKPESGSGEKAPGSPKE